MQLIITIRAIVINDIFNSCLIEVMLYRTVFYSVSLFAWVSSDSSKTLLIYKYFLALRIDTGRWENII